MDSSYTASAFLDRNGQYAKDHSTVATVRLFIGDGCEHVDLTVDAFNGWTVADKKAARLLPGRPECIGS